MQFVNNSQTICSPPIKLFFLETKRLLRGFASLIFFPLEEEDEETAQTSKLRFGYKPISKLELKENIKENYIKNEI